MFQWFNFRPSDGKVFQEGNYGVSKNTHTNKGTGHATKKDEFSGKFQTAFDPPLCIKVQNLQHKFLDREWPLPRDLSLYTYH